jgi:hypothetical protein
MGFRFLREPPEIGSLAEIAYHMVAEHDAKSTYAQAALLAVESGTKAAEAALASVKENMWPYLPTQVEHQDGLKKRLARWVRGGPIVIQHDK